MLRTIYPSGGNHAAQGTWAGLALATSPFVRKERTTTVMVRLGSAVMAEALTELLQSRGWRCCALTGADPDVIIVDAATIGKGLRLKYPRARILFLHLDESSREAALFCWHGAHAIIPQACGIHGLDKILKARARKADGEEPPLPFTPQERKVIAYVCRGGTTEEIARALRISTHTVKVYVHAILAKTRAPNRVSLVTLLGDCAREEGNE